MARYDTISIQSIEEKRMELMNDPFALTMDKMIVVEIPVYVMQKFEEKHVANGGAGGLRECSS